MKPTIFSFACLALGSLILVPFYLVYALWFIHVPTNEHVNTALQHRFPYTTYGLSEQATTFASTRIGRPRKTGVGDPKLWIWVQATDTHGRTVEGLINIAIIGNDPRYLDMGDLYTSDKLAVDPRWLATHFTEDEVTRIQTLMSR